MGYRSNGGIVIYGPEDVMAAFLVQERLRSDNTVAHNDDSVKIYKRGDDLVWHLEYEYWKWYEDYPDVAAFERVWTTAYEISEEYRELHSVNVCEPTTYKSLSGFRWRFGEDSNDTESDTFGLADNYDVFQVQVERHAVHDFLIPDDPELLLKK